MPRTTKHAIAVLATAAAAWIAVAGPAIAGYYVSSTLKISSSTPSWVATSGSYAYNGGTTSCSSSKPCLVVTASFPSNGTSVSGYLVVSYYRSSTSTNTSGTLIGTVTSPSFSIPKGSTATWSKTLAYQCKSLATTTTYYWAKAQFRNTSLTLSSDTAVASSVLGRVGCAS